MSSQSLADPPPSPWRGAIVVAVVVGALVVWRAVTGPGPDAPPKVVPSPLAPEPTAAPPAPPRCEELAAEPFVIGEPPKPPKASPREPGAAPDPGAPDPSEEPDDPTAPFAVEVGRGAAFEGGFAIGARRDEKTGAIAMVATVGKDGKDGKLVRLGRIRGDLDAPVVAGAGRSILAVMIEPNAGGRALKVSKVDGDHVTWGPELAEGRDDSLALDVAASQKRAIIVWDDLVGTSSRSAIMLAGLDVTTMRIIANARPVSAESEDAERPRIVARPGGYWLAYAVRGKAPKPSRKEGEKKRDDDEDRELGEAITTSYVELVPLDESGAPVGAARVVTPKTGHVLSFDLELGEDGGALIAWRDDDTPTGSSGGRLLSTIAKLGGVSEARVLAEETASAGVPELLPGWISLGSVNGATRLGGLSPRGELTDDLQPEKALGAGVPAAAIGDTLLLARPMGQAMRLSVVRCTPRPAATKDGG
jgi:hypothetical protein